MVEILHRISEHKGQYCHRLVILVVQLLLAPHHPIHTSNIIMQKVLLHKTSIRTDLYVNIQKIVEMEHLYSTGYENFSSTQPYCLQKILVNPRIKNIIHFFF